MVLRRTSEALAASRGSRPVPLGFCTAAMVGSDDCVGIGVSRRMPTEMWSFRMIASLGSMRRQVMPGDPLRRQILGREILHW